MPIMFYVYEQLKSCSIITRDFVLIVLWVPHRQTDVKPGSNNEQYDIMQKQKVKKQSRQIMGHDDTKACNP